MQVIRPVSLLLFVGLAGCATLPRSGPTGSQIRKSLEAGAPDLPVEIVEIATAADVPTSQATASRSMLGDAPIPPTDLIGPGDVLDINIYEAGVALFSGGASASPSAAGAAGVTSINPGVQVQKLPPSRVDDHGDIWVPYVGKLHVQGLTISEVQTMIQRGMRRLSQNPQVLVSFSQPITNTIIVGGEVARPGRLVLQTNRETLSDVIALAGGYRGNARDLALRVARGNETFNLRVEDLVEDSSLDQRVLPGDRVTLIASPRTFSVLGASGRVEQMPFTRSRLSLAEAVASAGGVNPNFGDPRAIFLFRFVQNASGEDKPVVYHLNMMNAGSYLLAQRFPIRDKDVLYFGNAAANQPAKLFQLVSQLFTPLVTVTAATQTLKN